MAVPHFVNIEHDEAGRKAYVTVEDREVKKQREMWGMSPFPSLFFPDFMTGDGTDRCGKEQHAPTSKTTSWASQKATPPSFVS